MACVLLFRQEYEGRAKGEAMRWLVGWGRLFWPQDADYGGGFGCRPRLESELCRQKTVVSSLRGLATHDGFFD